jgi:hypothetical protein
MVIMRISRLYVGSALALGLAVVTLATGCDSQSNAVVPTTASAIGSIDATAAKPAGDTAVTATIADSLNGFPLRVKSDGAGVYTNTTTTRSLIQGNTGDWELTTYTRDKRGNLIAGPRAVFFDLTEPVAPGNPPPPFQTSTLQAHLIAKCSVVGVNVLTIAAGTTASCPGDFRFDLSNTLAYRLSYAPNNFAEVNYMDITCLAADSKGCKQWTIATDGHALTGSDPNRKGVQKLLQIDPQTTGIIADLGDYYISFFISLAR